MLKLNFNYDVYARYARFASIQPQVIAWILNGKQNFLFRIYTGRCFNSLGAELGEEFEVWVVASLLVNAREHLTTFCLGMTEDLFMERLANSDNYWGISHLKLANTFAALGHELDLLETCENAHCTSDEGGSFCNGSYPLQSMTKLVLMHPNPPLRNQARLFQTFINIGRTINSGSPHNGNYLHNQRTCSRCLTPFTIPLVAQRNHKSLHLEYELDEVEAMRVASTIEFLESNGFNLDGSKVEPEPEPVLAPDEA